MKKIFKTLLNILLLKAGPEDIPYSNRLLVLFSGLEVIIGLALNRIIIYIVSKFAKEDTPLQTLGNTDLIVLGVVKLGILFVTLYSLLFFFNKKPRFVQTAVSIIGINLILSFVFLFNILLLQLTGFAIILFFVLLYWNFIVLTNIFSKSFETGLIKSGVLSIVYMLLQHNISGIVVQQLT